MNTQARTPMQADDYRASMQQAASRFIDRHQAEHLQDDGLFERTVRYLVTALEVPTFMADRIAHLAMSERIPVGKPLVSIDLRSGVAIDHRTGVRTTLPCRLLPQRFQAAPATR